MRPSTHRALRPYSLERRDPGANDFAIGICFCGICHTDLHFVKNDLGISRYPLLPGHEIVGEVERIGSGVTRFQPGDRVGVGCLVNSCRECASCREGEEQHCAGMVMTYASDDRDGTMTPGRLLYESHGRPGFRNEDPRVTSRGGHGAVTEPMPISSLPLLFGRRRVAGSLIGGIRQTQEMLAFCADHGITSDVEMIPAQKINEAYERLSHGDVRCRFVIDAATM